MLPVSVKSFQASGAPAGTVTTEYSPQGLVARQQVFSSKGSLVSIRTGAASDRGWRVVETSPSGAVLSVEERILGTHGEVVSVTLRDGRQLPLTVTEYEYDGSGRLISEVRRAGDGRLRTRTVYGYDARGNNSRVEVYDAGGTLNNVFERQYEGSNIVAEKVFDASGSLVALTKTTWKGAKKLTQEFVTPLSRTVEYSYGAADRPVAVTRSVRGEIVERQTLEYQ